MLARIRDIRSSGRLFWKKVFDIYATSVDYDRLAEVFRGGPEQNALGAARPNRGPK